MHKTSPLSPLLTQHQLVPRNLPAGVIGKLHGVDIDILVSIRADRLNHLPTYFIAGFLQRERKEDVRDQWYCVGCQVPAM